MHTYINTYIHTYIITYIHTYIHTCIHTYTHTYIHTHIHTYTHTHTHTWIVADPWLIHVYRQCNGNVLMHHLRAAQLHVHRLSCVCACVVGGGGVCQCGRIDHRDAQDHQDAQYVYPRTRAHTNTHTHTHLYTATMNTEPSRSYKTITHAPQSVPFMKPCPCLSYM